jgi:hypothetical protein
MELAIRQLDNIIPPFADTQSTAGFKRCPRCPSRGRNELRDIGDFGICRARKDGLNLYCKQCIREKINLGRESLREWKKNLKERAKANSNSPIPEETTPVRGFIDANELQARRIDRLIRKLPPTDRVREAIRLGAHTLKEIVAATKLPVDEVCDSIASLLLWKRSIRTCIIGHQRMYFINEEVSPSIPPKVQRAQRLNSTFSSIKILMPDRRTAVRRKTG